MENEIRNNGFNLLKKDVHGILEIVFEKNKIKGEESGIIGEWEKLQGDERKKNWPSTYLRWSDNEMTFDRDEILDNDSLQRGEYFYKVGFSIQWFDSTIQVGVCFP